MSLTREVFFCSYGDGCGADLSRPDHGEPALSCVAMGQRQAAPQRNLCAGVRPITLRGGRISTSSLRPTGVRVLAVRPDWPRPGPPRGKAEW